MTEVIHPPVAETASETDLVTAIRTVLAASAEPMTPAKIRAALPASFRSVSPEALAETLNRQVAANVLVQYPKYRSPQDRYWDRPLRVHVAHLLETILQEKALPASELRRKLPDYAKALADSVLEEMIAQGKLHRHPPTTPRGGTRYGTQPPSPKDFVRAELTGLFTRLERLGFTVAQLRQTALELLHEEEWATTYVTTTPEPKGQTATESQTSVSGTPATATQTQPTQTGYTWTEPDAPASIASGPPEDRPAPTEGQATTG
jgi:hypothetical protein